MATTIDTFVNSSGSAINFGGTVADTGETVIKPNNFSNNDANIPIGGGTVKQTAPPPQIWQIGSARSGTSVTVSVGLSNIGVNGNNCGIAAWVNPITTPYANGPCGYVVYVTNAIVTLAYFDANNFHALATYTGQTSGNSLSAYFQALSAGAATGTITVTTPDGVTQTPVTVTASTYSSTIGAGAVGVLLGGNNITGPFLLSPFNATDVTASPTLVENSINSTGGIFTANPYSFGTGAITVELWRAPAPGGTIGAYAPVGAMTVGSPYTDATASPGYEYAWKAIYTDSTTPTPMTATSNVILATTWSQISITDSNILTPGSGISGQLLTGGGLRFYQSGAQSVAKITGTENINLVINQNRPTGSTDIRLLKSAVDQAPYVETQLTPGLTRVNLLTGSSSTTHEVYIAVENISVEGWSTGDSVDFLYYEVDNGAATAALGTTAGNIPALVDRGADIVGVGDSITDAAHDPSGNPYYGTQSFFQTVAAGLGLNAIQLGAPGDTSNDVANLFNYYYDSGPSRLVGGKLKTLAGRMPSAIIIALGRNGNGPGPISSFLTSLRAMVNTTTEIYIATPFSHLQGYYPSASDCSAAFAAGFGTVTSAGTGALILASDPYTALIDTGLEMTAGLYAGLSMMYPPSSFASQDNLHLTPERSATGGALIVSKINLVRVYRAAGGGGGGSGSSFYTFIS